MKSKKILFISAIVFAIAVVNFIAGTATPKSNINLSLSQLLELPVAFAQEDEDQCEEETCVWKTKDCAWYESCDTKSYYDNARSETTTSYFTGGSKVKTECFPGTSQCTPGCSIIMDGNVVSC